MNRSHVAPTGSLPLRAALTLVEARLPSDLFLLRRFESFYQEVVKLKRKLAGHSSHHHVPLSPEEVREPLLSLLGEQEAELAPSVTLLGAEMYRQAQRVMACMADEIFSKLHWPAGTVWRSMEAELFDAIKPDGLAPEGACMKKLDRILQQDDPAYRELASIYFYALSLSQEDHKIREQYLPPLVQMIGGAGDEAAEGHPVFAQSYAHTQAENKVALLPSINRWWLALAIIVLVWLGISSAEWLEISSPVKTGLQQMRTLRP